MNRRQDRGRSYGGDGLLGEGPSMGGAMYEPMMNSQVNQLLLAQQLLQHQAMGAGGPYGDMGPLGGAGGMPYRNQGGYNDRKRPYGPPRDNDFKRRRRDSFGRSDRDRSRGRDGGSRSTEGRDKNRSNRWDSDRDKEGDKGEDDYDPAEPTEDEDRKDKDGNLYCHVCNISVYDDESFRRHLNGMKHTQRMNSLLTVHQMKSTQLQSRLFAEEHLRKIEQTSGGNSEFFCKICNNTLTIPWERHRFSNIHKQRHLQVKRGCGWCKVFDFGNFTEVLEHRETEEHKKNASLYGKRRDGSDRSGSRSPERRSDKHRSYYRDSHDHSKKDKDEDSEDEDLTIPEFNSENAVGVKYIIPVTGYFCKLCHKFYNNEKSAKGSHCQTEAHYEKFKAAVEEKQAAREKRLAERAAAEEERKLKEAEKKAAGEDSEDKLDEGLSKDADEDRPNNDDRHHDDEDYDDELPIEDHDNEGGLVKDGDYSIGYEDGVLAASKDNVSADQYQAADSGYGYFAGPPDQAQVEPLEDYRLLEPADKAGDSTLKETTSSQEEASSDQSPIAIDKDDSDEEPATTPKSASKGKSGGTARRGRGRGRGKK